MIALTEEQFDKLNKDVPEDGFRTLVPLLMESFAHGRGRNLSRIQVAALTTGLLEMSATIDSQITYIGELQQQLEEQKPKKRFWTPHRDDENLETWESEGGRLPPGVE